MDVSLKLIFMSTRYTILRMSIFRCCMSRVARCTSRTNEIKSSFLSFLFLRFPLNFMKKEEKELQIYSIIYLILLFFGLRLNEKKNSSQYHERAQQQRMQKKYKMKTIFYFLSAVQFHVEICRKWSSCENVSAISNYGREIIRK